MTNNNLPQTQDNDKQKMMDNLQNGCGTPESEDSCVDIIITKDESPTRTYLKQAALQMAALIAILSLIWPYFILHDKIMPWREVSLGIGALALLIACLTKQAWWWRPIHALFAPMLWFTSTLAFHPGWFMLAFITTLFISRGALTGQIPLYFSNRHCASAVAQLIVETHGQRLIDLGAGIGSMIVPLSRLYPQANYTGIENAPIPWLIGTLRTQRHKNCQWQWKNFWQVNLAEYDVVYAFLSPTPMTKLWQKAQHEMRPGSLFISNSFPVPGIEASQTLEIDDTRQTRLFCYLVKPKQQTVRNQHDA